MKIAKVSNLKELQATKDLLDKIVAYPTESVFGLGCRIDKLEVIERILALKERDANKGFVILATSLEQVSEIVDLDLIPQSLKELLKHVNHPRKPFKQNSLLSKDKYPGVSESYFNSLVQAIGNIRSEDSDARVRDIGEEDNIHIIYLERILYILKSAYQQAKAHNLLAIGEEAQENLSQALHLVAALHSTGQGLTFLLPAKKDCPEVLRGKFATVAVRITHEPFLMDLINTFGGAIVSTSANYSGSNSLRTAEQVVKMLESSSNLYEQEQVVVYDQPVIYGQEKEVNESILLNLLPKESLEKLASIGEVPKFGVLRNAKDLLVPNLEDVFLAFDDVLVKQLAVLRLLVDLDFTLASYTSVINLELGRIGQEEVFGDQQPEGLELDKVLSFPHLIPAYKEIARVYEKAKARG
ncbi:hypothetical protein CKF54_02670 [Psittacicella hinzii]|uniref:L-threonylcarbamoyladenylate synthase n=1 Tax=Psittacicella hinzii TaxID=2028575 RepID=A0A3A1Y7N1_9GAMM|nr:Sua5/YciO/YrdC/YwlC family protein [Psittacicella hinzii]RIY33531.1 hypothetical protein CKF54_02670 [Psittacicella hinzii]